MRVFIFIILGLFLFKLVSLFLDFYEIWVVDRIFWNFIY